MALLFRRQSAMGSTCRWRTTASLAASVLVAIAGGASAQPLGEAAGRARQTHAYQAGLADWDDLKMYGAEAVLERDRSEWQPAGLPAGNFVFLPQGSFDLTFDDTLPSGDGGHSGDFYATTSAGIKMQSRLPRHVFDLSVDGTFVTYLENVDQNYEDGSAAVAARFDIDAGNAVFVEGNSAYKHTPRFDADEVLGAAEATPVWQNFVETGYVRDYGRTRLIVGAYAGSNDFEDVYARDGSVIDQDYRDKTSFGGYLNLHYRFSPGYSMFGAVGSERSAFWDAAEADNDAWKTTVKSGVEWEFDRLVRGTFSAGYSYKDYDAASRSDFGSVVWDARVDWLAAPELNLFANAGQQFEETSMVGADGRLATKIGGGIIYEVLRNTVVSAELDLEHSDFLGTTREDLTWTARLGAQYLMNKNLKFTFAYEHLERESSFDQFDGDSNRVKVGVSWSF